MTSERAGSSLLAIPPYLREGRTREYVRGATARFHRAAFELAEPIEFPRAIFADVLREHARLLDLHAAAVMAAPLDRPWWEVGDEEDRSRHVEIIQLQLSASVLVVEGSTVEIHRWRSAQASWVLQRSRGIVRKLLMRPPDEHTYLVVIAGGVASMHLMRGVPPARAGEGERLEIVGRDVVVEPWDQWHLRRAGHVFTFWRTPAGELATSRVAAPPHAKGGDAICEALLRVYDDELRRAIAAYVPDEPGAKPLVVLRSSRAGDEIDSMSREFAEFALRGYPPVLDAIGAAPPGFAPMVVDIATHALLAWCPVAALDVATPPRVHADDDSPDDSGPVDEKDVAFDEPPPVPAASVSNLVYRLETASLVLAMLGSLGGLLACIALAIAAKLEPEAGPFVYPLVFDLIFPVSLLVGVYVAGVCWQPSPASAPPAPRRITLYYGRSFWMGRLSQRLARLERLADLYAPEPVLEGSREIVHEAIAQLDPADAQAVLRAWPRAASLAGAGAAGAKKAEDRPN